MAPGASSFAHNSMESAGQPRMTRTLPHGPKRGVSTVKTSLRYGYCTRTCMHSRTHACTHVHTHTHLAQNRSQNGICQSSPHPVPVDSIQLHAPGMGTGHELGHTHKSHAVHLTTPSIPDGHYMYQGVAVTAPGTW